MIVKDHHGVPRSAGSNEAGSVVAWNDETACLEWLPVLNGRVECVWVEPYGSDDTEVPNFRRLTVEDLLESL